MTRIRLINIFLINQVNVDDSNDKKFKTSNELINLNELLLDLFDKIINIIIQNFLYFIFF